MQPFGLYVDLLPANEASLLRSIVRLSSVLGSRWHVTENQEDADVVMIDGDLGTSGQVPDWVAAKRRILVSRSPAAASGGACLYRPFRADSIISTLDAFDVHVSDGAIAPGGRRAKLTRWPVQHVSSASTATLHMATLLLRVPCSAAELAQRLALPPDTCVQFLARLDLDGLLTWEPSSTPDAETAAVAPLAAPVGTGRKLLSAIRRKLGLSGSEG